MPTYRKALEELAKLAGNANPKDTPIFHAVVSQAVEVLDVSHQELAAAFHVSRPTVTRWVNKVSAPHPALRPMIYDWVEAQARQRLQHQRRFAAEPG